jgi:hypothetical protein
MLKSKQNGKELTKSDVFQAEYDKLTSIFAAVEESKRKLVEGLINDASFLYAENWELRRLIAETGSIKIHPQHREMQKTLPAATQYLKNSNAYAVIIKSLNSILSKNVIEEDDEDLEDYE